MVDKSIKTKELVHKRIKENKEELSVLYIIKEFPDESLILDIEVKGIRIDDIKSILEKNKSFKHIATSKEGERLHYYRDRLLDAIKVNEDMIISDEKYLDSLTSFRKSLLVGIITVIISLVGSFAISHYTTVYQFELQQSTILPQLTITPADFHGEIPIFSAQNLIQEFKPSNLPQGEDFGICITNNKDIRTGHISFRLDSDWLTSDTGNIQEIQGNDFACEKVTLRSDIHRCTVNSVCNYSAIPSGIGLTQLKFNFQCANCNPKQFTKTFDVCIWANSGADCKNLTRSINT